MFTKIYDLIWHSSINYFSCVDFHEFFSEFCFDLMSGSWTAKIVLAFECWSWFWVWNNCTRIWRWV